MVGKDSLVAQACPTTEEAEIGLKFKAQDQPWVTQQDIISKYKGNGCVCNSVV